MRYLHQGPGGVVPELHPQGDVVDLGGGGAEVLVPEPRPQELQAAHLQGQGPRGAVEAGPVPRALRPLPSWGVRGQGSVTRVSITVIRPLSIYYWFKLYGIGRGYSTY